MKGYIRKYDDNARTRRRRRQKPPAEKKEFDKERLTIEAFEKSIREDVERRRREQEGNRGASEDAVESRRSSGRQSVFDLLMQVSVFQAVRAVSPGQQRHRKVGELKGDAMKRMYSFAAVVALIAFATPDAALAASSCSSWKRTCFSRCAGLGPKCKPNCEARAKECRSTGCFYAAAEGKQYCGLKKN